MKKLLAIILVLVFALSLVGCAQTDETNLNVSDITGTHSSQESETGDEIQLQTQKQDNETDTSESKPTSASSSIKEDSEKTEKPQSKPTNTSTAKKTKKDVKKIVDESHKYLKTGNIVKFYEKDFFNTYFTVSGENDGIIVHFKDGTKMGVVEAFKNKLVKISDLDKYGVKYIKDYSRSFFDLTEYYDCDVENKTQEFYRDENFSYTFPTQKADYVKYVDKNGKTWLAGDALKAGKIKHYDLGNFIDFDKKYIGNKLLIVNESEGYGTTQAFQEFYRDDNYKYEFSDGRCVMVYYPDGTSENVTKALKNGKIKVTDLDKFGIKYYKSSISEE
jgi:uncharacterized lipoprotein YehR (DUF1307 family)